MKHSPKDQKKPMTLPKYIEAKGQNDNMVSEIVLKKTETKEGLRSLLKEIGVS